MLAGIYNIHIEQGSTYSLNLTWKDDAGNPIDLTGYEARMKVRKSYSGPVVLSLTSDSGIVLGGALGTIDVTATALETSQIALDLATLTNNDGKPCQQMVWDIELEIAGVVTRILQGSAFIYPEATR